MDVVRVGREFAREMKCLPPRGVRADARVDLAVAALAEPPACLGVVAAERLQHLVVRNLIEARDADGVERLDVGGAASAHLLHEFTHPTVETGAVILLGPREMSQYVTRRPSLAA